MEVVDAIFFNHPLSLAAIKTSDSIFMIAVQRYILAEFGYFAKPFMSEF